MAYDAYTYASIENYWGNEIIGICNVERQQSTKSAPQERKLRGLDQGCCIRCEVGGHKHRNEEQSSCRDKPCNSLAPWILCLNDGNQWKQDLCKTQSQLKGKTIW